MPKINYYLRYLHSTYTRLAHYQVVPTYPIAVVPLLHMSSFSFLPQMRRFLMSWRVLTCVVSTVLYRILPVPYPYCFLSGWTVLLEHADLIIQV